MAPPLNQTNWLYGISDTPMVNYTDDGSNPSSLIKLVTADQQVAKIDVNTWNNEGYSTGVDWGTEQETQSHDVNIPINISPSMQMLERILKGLVGIPTTTTPSSGVTKNVHVPQDANTSRQLPAFWLNEKCGSAHDALYPSCVWTKGTFKGEELGRLNFSGNLRGSGKQILGAGLTLTPETAKYYLKNTASKVERATAATPGTIVSSYQCGLQSFMFDVDNANDQNIGYNPGCQRYFTSGDDESGVIRSFDIFGKRKYSGQFIVWLEASAPELALLRNQSEVYLNMIMTGKTIASTYKNLFGIEMHLAHYKAVELGNKSGFVTMQISVDAFYQESTNKIVSLTTQYATPA